MSAMQMDPQMLQQILGGMGGGGMPGGGAEMGGAAMQGPPPGPQGGGENWLSDMINLAQESLYAASDAQDVSVLGKIMDLLTTIQAKKAQAGGGV